MAKRTVNRRELREQAEAAEKIGTSKGAEAAEPKKAKEKKKAPPKPKRSKVKVVVRRRLLWGVFSSSSKEEARFPYAERDAAVSKANDLHQKTKRTYFIQPIKEPIPESELAPAEAKS
jgi:hypothetical protein